MNDTFSNSMNKDNSKKYVSLKNKAKKSISQKRFYEAKDLLMEAYELYNQDSEICSMMGYCLYELSSLNEALKFCKLAYELDNRRLDNIFIIGRILLEQEKYSESVYYFQEYISEADKYNSVEHKAAALRHLGYCYYYMDDFANSKYYFEESSKIDSRNRYTNIFLNNIGNRLNGKKVWKKEKYEEFHGLYKPVNMYNTCEKENRKSSGRKKSVKSIISIILSIISIGIFIDNKFINKKENNETTVSESVSSTNKNSSEHFITTVTEYLQVPFNMPASIKVDDIKGTDYYELSEAFKENVIYSKEDIDKNDWWNDVECRIYTGDLSGNRIIFSIPMNECNKAEEKGNYNISGAKREINRNIEDDIVNNTVNSKKYIWTTGVYVTSQKNMVNEAENLKKSSYINDEGKTVKVIKSADEFRSNNYSDLQSVYLTEILPLDYYEYHKSESNIELLTKEEMNKKKINPDSCTQMYAGKLDDLEIAFTDPEFSMAEIDDNGGYRIEGNRACMGRSSIQVNVQGNYGGKSNVDIYWWYMRSSQ